MPKPEPPGEEFHPRKTEGPLIAITIHRVPRKAFCGVVVLVQNPDESWTGECSQCKQEFRIDKDPKFKAQVLALRN